MKNEIWKMTNGESFSLPVSSVVIFLGEAMKGVEPLSSGLQDRRSGIQLSYIAIDLVELRGVEPLRPACKAGIIPLDHSPEIEGMRYEG
jgi:hypothetical protein